jgi:hypothetical protein
MNNIVNKIEHTFPKGSINNTNSWFVKDTLKSIVKHGEEVAKEMSDKKQPKMFRTKLNSSEYDVTLSPNTFTDIESISDTLYIHLEKPLDTSIPTYNAHFTLTEAYSPESLVITNDFDYDLFWVSKVPVEPYKEYGLFVQGNMGWLTSKPLTVIEAVYNVGRINTPTTLMSSAKNKSGNNTSDASMVMLIDGVKQEKASASYTFGSKGRHKVSFLFKEFPSLSSCFSECTDVVGAKVSLATPGHKTDSDRTFSGATSFEYIDILNEGVAYEIYDAANMFSGCKLLQDDVVNKFIKSTGLALASNASAHGMFNNCSLLENIDISAWNFDGRGILGTTTDVKQIISSNKITPLLSGSSTIDGWGDTITSLPIYEFVKVVDLSNGELPYKEVNFYSMDTIVASYTTEEALALEDFPEIPEYDGYESHGWGITFEEFKTKVEEDKYYNAIAHYTRSEDIDYHLFDLSIGSNTLSIIFDDIIGEGTEEKITIDWGDETVEEFLLNACISVDEYDNKRQEIMHYYDSPLHNYSVKIYPNESILKSFHFFNKGLEITSASKPEGSSLYSFAAGIFNSIGLKGRKFTHSSFTVSSTESIYNLNYKVDSNDKEVTYAPVSSVISGSYIKRTSEPYVLNLYFNCSSNTANINNFNIHNVEYANFGIEKISYLANIIPESATSISNNVSYYYYDPVSIYVPDSVKNMVINSKITEAINIPNDCTGSLYGEMFNFVDTRNNSVDVSNLNNNRKIFTTPGQSSIYVKDGRHLRDIDIPESVTSLSLNKCWHLDLNDLNLDNITSLELIDCNNIYELSIKPNVNYNIVSCNNLEKLNIDSSITVINDYFEDLKALHYITLPENLTTINNSAFKGSGLWELNIPETVTTIGESAFEGCKYISRLYIPDGVTSIGNKAFSYIEDLGVLRLPNNMEIIEEQFSGCSNVYEVEMPANIKEVSYSFPNTSIERMVIKDIDGWCRVFLDSHTGINAQYYLYQENSEPTPITEVTIPEDITEIPKYFNFGKLETINIGPQVTSISSNSLNEFYLKQINIDENNPVYETMGTNALILKDSKKLYKAYYNSIIPEGVKIIGEYAYSNGIVDGGVIDIPESVTEIEKSAFSHSNVSAISGAENVNFVGYNAFYETKFNPSTTYYIGNVLYTLNEKLAEGETVEVEIKEGTTQIYNNAVRIDSQISKITLPKTIKHIGGGSLAYLSKLTEPMDINFPELVTIEDSAFRESIIVSEVNLPRIETIGYSAFNKCTTLQKITFGPYLTDIDSTVFSGCTSLNTIEFTGPIAPTFANTAFNNIAAEGTLRIPIGTSESYSKIIQTLSTWTVEEVDF